MPLHAPGDFNQALMELGANDCLPNGAPQCERCPAAGFCTALREERINQLPVKAPKKARRVEELEVFLIFREGRVALRRRGERGLLAGLWEYPNAPAPAEDALDRWGIVPERCRRETGGRHIFTHVEWHMTARVVEAGSDALPQGWVWASRDELERVYAVPNAFQSLAHLVSQGLGLV